LRICDVRLRKPAVGPGVQVASQLFSIDNHQSPIQIV
jgi:hypothetical protein